MPDAISQPDTSSAVIPPADGFTTDNKSFIIGVPSDGPTVASEYGNYLRLGGVNLDEADLQEDPAASPKTAKLFDTLYAKAFNDGVLAYSTGTVQVAAPYGYMRLGAPAPYELWLQADPDADLATVASPATPGADPAKGKFGAEGMVLHTTQTLNMFAPTINQTASTINTAADEVSTWSGDTLSAVFNGWSVGSISHTAPDPITSILSTSALQIADNFASTVGSNVGTIIGNNTSIWTGNDASTGFGSLLWSNYGSTQNVFAGQIVNITNGNIDVQGWGEAKISDFEVMAPQKIELAIAPTVAVTGFSMGMLKALKGLNIATAAIMAAASALLPASTGIWADVVKNKRTDSNGHIDQSGLDNDLKTVLNTFKTEMRVVVGLVSVIQIMAIVAGKAAGRVAEAEELNNSASITLTNGQIELSAGGTTVTVNAAGFRVDAGNPAKIADALAVQAAVAVANIANENLMGEIFRSAATAAALAPGGVGAAAAAAAATQDFINNPPPVPTGPPSILLNGMLVKTSAVQFQSNMPMP